MNVVYASDNNFVEVFGISMLSLFENNAGEEVNVYLLADNIEENNQKILLEIANNYNQKLIIIPVDVDDFSRVKLDILTWSKAAFSRMFLGTILKKYGVKRALYLDCDVAVVGNIKELWNYNLGDKTLGMVIDPLCAAHKRNVGLKDDDPYFNSGVLLIDVEKWIENDCENKLQDFAEAHDGMTPYVDQGLINGALHEFIKTLPLKYNVITVYFDYSYKELIRYRKPSGEFYSESEVEDATSSPCIIHYTKCMFTERPWIVGSTHKKKEVWEKYKGLSPWKNSELKPKTVRGIRRVYVNISKKLPRRLNIAIQSFLHTVIKPYYDVH